MIKFLTLGQIKRIIAKLPHQLLIDSIEEGFVLYSNGKLNVPPVGHLSFQAPPGDVHIKYGYLYGGEIYIVKIVSGFYENSLLGLQANHGIVLVFNSKTGQPQAILLDEGWLTDVRTGLAGALAAKYLAPSSINCIGILGTGIQARMQLFYLKTITSCRKVFVWGRNPKKVRQIVKELSAEGWEVKAADSIRFLAERSNLIITTTASKEPLLSGEYIQPGTHITSVGADAPGKQEIAVSVFEKASIIVADSLTQCIDHGDIRYAIQSGTINKDAIHELGKVVANPSLQRSDDNQITIADLTGVAVQDIQIARLVLGQFE